jgi:hypothetical protein
MARKHTIYDPTIGLTIDIPFTPDEERARDQEEADAALESVNALKRQELRDFQRASAIKKLGALGLTSSEIEAVIGT